MVTVQVYVPFPRSVGDVHVLLDDSPAPGIVQRRCDRDCLSHSCRSQAWFRGHRSRPCLYASTRTTHPIRSLQSRADRNQNHSIGGKSSASHADDVSTHTESDLGRPAVTLKSREASHVTRKAPARIAHGIALVSFLTLVPAANAGKGVGTGGKPGGGATTCTRSEPRASIDNTWAWASPGSWGLPGQQLGYAIDVFNNDVGCGSSSFAVTFSAPSGFSVSMPSSTITLSSASSGYVWAYVTSPSTPADGDYPLSVSVQRGGSSSPAASSGTSYYKVYSTDTVAPKLYWENPLDGGSLSGRTTYVGFTSSDDHAVKRLDLSVDGATVASTLCDNISSDCQVSYKWSIRRVHGQHTATYRSTDWMGNVATETATFTVN